MNLMELMVQIGVNDQASGVISGLATGVRSFAKVGVAAVGAVATGMVAFGKSAVTTGAQFDKSMSQVAATLGVTTDQIGDLRDFAMDMGATTAFSAVQAADALNYMALAGYDSTKSMQMLPTVLDLAAAGGMELARASDMVTDAESALGLQAGEASTMVDQMAKTASKSNTSVEQLGDAILTIGGTAKFMAGGTDRLNTVLGILADNGIKGSEAGTHLRNMLLKLSAPTDKGAKLIKQMGLNIYDGSGKMRDMKDIMVDLNGAMSDMSDEQKVQTISELFNARDIAAVNALLGTSVERWDELGEAIANSDEAAKIMAATQLDNLTGDTILFKSALEGAKIVISDALTPSLREFVQFGTKGLQEITEGFKEGGLSGAMSAFGTVLSEGLNMIISSTPQFVDAAVQLTGSLAKGLIDNLPAIADAGLQIVGNLASTFVEALPGMLELGSQLMQMVGNGIQVAGGFVVDMAHTVWTDVLGGSEESWEQISTATSEAWNSIKDSLSSIWGSVKEHASFLWNGLKDFFSENGSAIGASIASAWTTISGKLSAYWSALSNLAKSIFTGLQNFWNTWGGTITTIFSTVWDTITTAFSGWLDVLTTLFGAFSSLFQGDWEGFWDGILATGEALWNALSNTLSALWAGIQATGAAIWAAIGADITAAWESIKATTSSMWEAIKTAVADVWDGIKSSVSAAVESVESTVSGVWESMKSTASEVWDGIKSTISDTVNSISETISSSFNAVLSTATGVWNSIKNAISDAINGAKDIVSEAIEGIKGLFDFSWSLPHISLPHFSLGKGISVLGITLPSINVDWYKKAYENPYLFDKPTVVGAKGFGDGNGGEMVYGHSRLMSDIRNAVGQIMPQQIKLYLDGDKLVGGTSDRMDSSLGEMQQYQLRWEGA